MNKIQKLLIVAALVIIIGFSTYSVAKANPSFFNNTSSTATATTSVVYMTPGTATTTVSSDSFVFDTFANNGATILAQLTGSTSAATLGIEIQYSQDGIDWFEDNLSAGATTTQTVSISQKNTLTWNAGSVASTTRKAISVATPTRYVKAIFTMTGGNGSLWATIIPKREKN